VDDNEAPEPVQSSRRPLITGLVVLVLAVGVGVAVFLWLRAPRAPAQQETLMREGEILVESWLADVRGGRLASAYEATSPEFRAQLDRAAFDELAKERSALKHPPNIANYAVVGGKEGGVTLGPGGFQKVDDPLRFTYRVIITGAIDPDEIEIVARMRDGRLVIDQLVLDPP
jgi:hypothetical protein